MTTLLASRKEAMTPAKKELTMNPRTLKRVRLGDNREIRIVRIPTGFDESLIRIGINMLPNGENLSGAVFPESYLDDLIDALDGVRNG